MVRWHMIAMLSIVLLVGGCVPPSVVISQVTRFHDLQVNLRGSFFVMPLNDQDGSLEFRQYAKAIADEMVRQGFREAMKPGDADFWVYATYGVDQGRSELSSQPVFGQTGGGNTTFVIPRTGQFATAYTQPTFGIVGSQLVSERIYTRTLAVDIVDWKASTNEKAVKILEGRVRSEGLSPNLSMILPYMISAMFEDFPGQSGKTVRVEREIKE